MALPVNQFAVGASASGLEDPSKQHRVGGIGEAEGMRGGGGGRQEERTLHLLVLANTFASPSLPRTNST